MTTTNKSEGARTLHAVLHLSIRYPPSREPKQASREVEELMSKEQEKSDHRERESYAGSGDDSTNNVAICHCLCRELKT
jgi:hypothetical protein